MGEQERVEKYVATARAINIDPDTLRQLTKLVAAGKKTVLLGFNDYAKHLVNLYPERIAAILDLRAEYCGLNYRGTPIKPVAWPDCDQLLVCAYRDLLSFKRVLYARCAETRTPFLFAARYHKQSTKMIDFMAQDAAYQTIFDGSPRPNSMLSEGALFFLLELVRSTLPLPGDVAEVGAWQGGSAWHIARMLSHAHSQKHLYVFDLGEAAAPSNPQSVVCEDQMRQDLAFYEHTTCLFGSAERNLSAIGDARFAFVFLDFGFNAPLMEFFWDRLVPGGILLLDNYGHTLGHPDLFDAYLAKKGATAVRQHNKPAEHGQRS